MLNREKTIWEEEEINKSQFNKRDTIGNLITAKCQEEASESYFEK